MSHLIVKNPFLPDSFGLDYDSPRSRSFGLNATLLRSLPRRFRNPGGALPRWLNFKTSASATLQNPQPEAPTSARSEESQRTPQRTLRRDSSLSNSTRSGKSANSASSLRKKVEEHEMKTKTDEWKKNREYKVVRERRNLTKKQTNPNLRLIRRFYVPSIFCIGLGVVFIFGSTVHSLGDGTVFWTYKETFKIIGLITTTSGVIMLLVTVGCESRSSEKWKKKGIHEIDPFIHPDFLKERERSRVNKKIFNQTSESSFHGEISPLSTQRVLWKVTDKDDENSYLCSSIKSASSVASKVTAMDRFIFQKMRWRHLDEEDWKDGGHLAEEDVKDGRHLGDADSLQCSNTRSASDITTNVDGEARQNKRINSLKVANEDEEEAFLCSRVQTVQSALNLNGHEGYIELVQSDNHKIEYWGNL